MTITRKIELRSHDTSIGIWQDDPNDPTFEREIYGGLNRLLRDLGWTVGQDPKVHKRHRILSPQNRLAKRGDLRAKIRITGRAIEVTVWAETWPIDNPNGREYDFGKLARMTYLDRLRFRLLHRRIAAWLQERAIVAIAAPGRSELPSVGGITAAEYIARDYAASVHKDKELGRPVPRYAYNCTSRDERTIEHGSKVWFLDRKGRICRGTAFYNINNMWWVVVGAYGLRNLATHEILVEKPEGLRVKRNERARRERLEAELSKAVIAMNFERAATLRRVLFGDAPVFLIWSKEKDAYYRSCSAGYTTDASRAGRYLRDEAERIVAPHDFLTIIDPTAVAA
ncbi:hypothetical protein AA309_19975 [Microvirga vignae]|uniref:UVR domain-containing protein n=1 Tax=Microvirga vignae TaxID=1225564 RepID=A0A0H1RFL8_9HYPH|nr:hypothetical protein [Microvirga vignae]KLK91382.1 hypothetical protein AA309_19975 [Microvirga vignae]